MSIQSVVANEVARNTTTPQSKRGGGDKPKGEALVDVIPTELLAPYTGILAVIVANAATGTWETGRWVLFGVTTVLVPIAVFVLWRGDSTNPERKTPLAGMVGATLAFGAWGLVMPGGPLTYVITDGPTLAIWTTIVVTVVTAIIGFLPLNKQVKQP
jgi:hypothetical protein